MRAKVVVVGRRIPARPECRTWKSVPVDSLGAAWARRISPAIVVLGDDVARRADPAAVREATRAGWIRLLAAFECASPDVVARWSRALPGLEFVATSRWTERVADLSHRPLRPRISLGDFVAAIGREAARRDETRRDETRRDETRRDETRRDETRRLLDAIERAEVPRPAAWAAEAQMPCRSFHRCVRACFGCPPREACLAYACVIARALRADGAPWRVIAEVLGYADAPVALRALRDRL